MMMTRKVSAKTKKLLSEKVKASWKKRRAKYGVSYGDLQDGIAAARARVESVEKQDATNGHGNEDFAPEGAGVPTPVPSSAYGDGARYLRPDPLRNGGGIFVVPYWGLNPAGRMEAVVRVVAEGTGATLSLRQSEASVLGEYLVSWVREQTRASGFMMGRGLEAEAVS